MAKLDYHLLLSEPKFTGQYEYWLHQLSGAPPDSGLGWRPDQAGAKYGAKKPVPMIFPEDLGAKIIRLAKNSDISIYLLLVATLKCLIYLYTGKPDILVGSPVYLPNCTPETFNDRVVIRDRIAPEMTFKNLLFQVRENTLAAYEQQDYPFDQIWERLGKNKTGIEVGPVKIFCLLQGIHDQEFIARRFDYELAFVFGRTETGVQGTIFYDENYIEAWLIQQFSRHLIHILEQAVNQPELPLAQFVLITDAEKQWIFNELNQTKAAYPREKTVGQLFEVAAAQYPERIAVVCGGRTISFQALNQYANQLAIGLREKGVLGNQIIGVMMERSLEMIVGILGVLKSGAAYLPLDPAYPPERIEYMLADSQVRFIVASEQPELKIPLEKQEIIPLALKGVELPNPPEIHNINEPADIAYVIYTSGSTGRPKGVLVEHRNVVNYVCWRIREYGINSGDTTLQLISVSFDGFGANLYSSLLSGGNLAFPDEQERHDYSTILKIIRDEKVTNMSIVPSMYRGILEFAASDDLKTLRFIVLGGEKPDPALLKLSASLYPNLMLINEYGPTENTITSTFFRGMTPEKAGIIGRPIANNEVYILRNGRLAPPGVPGQLWVTGAGLARGYLNNPEMTAEKFVFNPFHIETFHETSLYETSLHETPLQRMYQTGDRCQWLPDGLIEFLGRSDEQVKIRGFRVEPAEIETRLLGYEPINEVAVIAKKDEAGHDYLGAFFTASRTIAIKDLREYLAQILPEYMIPAHFIQLEKMPLLPNGKIDPAWLRQMTFETQSQDQYIAPRNLTEEKLSRLWGKILGVAKIGIEDHFFEMGGQSLKATLLAALLKQEFDVTATITDIFKFPRLKEMAGFIQNAKKIKYQSIQATPRREYYPPGCYPASSAQKRMFILNQFEDTGFLYHIPIIIRVEGSLDRERLEKTFQTLMDRHDTLRSSFAVRDGEVVQYVHDAARFTMDYFLREQLKPGAWDEEIRKLLQPFDLGQAPLFRASLLKLSDTLHLLVCDSHHIISDAVSMEILIEEFMRIYDGETLPELKIQYQDFAAWQNELLKSDQMKAQEKYWLERFAGDIPVLNLPADFPRTPVLSFEGDELFGAIDESLSAQLNRLAMDSGVTLFIILLTAFNVLLSKYTGQDDIIVGTVVAGRTHADLERLIGMFVNTLPMRNLAMQELTFQEFVFQVKENALQAYENQDYQFEELVDALNLKRDLSRNPLFDTMFTLQNTGHNGMSLPGLTLTPVPFTAKIAKFDLTVNAIEFEGKIGFNFEYRTKKFTRETIARWAKHFTFLLEQAARNPEFRLRDLELMTSEEKREILTGFNGPTVDYPRSQTVHQLFEAQAQKSPGRLATVFGPQHLTYSELNVKANQLAQVLRGKGIVPGNVVGVLCEQRLEMLIGILAILKAGAGYLPLDVTYPRERIRYMLQNSGVSILLTTLELTGAEYPGVEFINLTQPELYTGDGRNLDPVNQARDLAYLIYTSGSTGHPKGVMIEHCSLINFSYWYIRYYQLGENDRISKYASAGFDASVLEIFPALLASATLYIVPEDLKLDLRKLKAYIEQQGLTIVFLPTGIYEQFSEYGPCSLRKLSTGGDRLRHYVPRDYEVINNYGPTESTVAATAYTINTQANNIPIGKPIFNTKVYIVDRYNNLQPIGAPGELCIAGDGLARGYINNPDGTAERFVPNPFKIMHNEAHQKIMHNEEFIMHNEEHQKTMHNKEHQKIMHDEDRQKTMPSETRESKGFNYELGIMNYELMYKTGDLARWLPDGNIEFMGRLDSQIKIRGYRIELGEIEKQLLKHEWVQEALVTVHQVDHEEIALAAYFVSDHDLTAYELKDFLGKYLPDYMIPSFFTPLKELPLTAHGKIDLKGLPAPDRLVGAGAHYQAPQNMIESKLVILWEEILGITGLGTTDNFFEIGGHSLKATVLVARIHELFEVELPLNVIFKAPTIQELAGYIHDSKKIPYHSIGIAEPNDFYPASSAQRRLFLLNQIGEVGVTYNMPGALFIEGELDRKRVTDALRGLIERHETLRTSFVFSGGEIKQQIHPRVDFETGYIESGEEKIRAEIIPQFIQPFDLEKAPLLRALLVKISDRKHVLIYDLHHIIADGASMAILVREFIALYQHQALPPLRIQYKDYSVWQKQWFETGVIKAEEDYWSSAFGGEIPMLNLPLDYPRPLVQNFLGDSFNFEIGRELTAKLKQAAAETKTTLFMVLLAIYNLLLSKYTGQEDIIVGTPIAGRPHADLENLIGMFVNTLAMRNYPSGGKTFREFLYEVRENSIRAYENQDYPFEDLLERLKLRRDLTRNPLFDTMLTLQEVEPGGCQPEGLQFQPLTFTMNIAKFDLAFYGMEREGNLHFSIEYCVKLFSKETIAGLARHFVHLASQTAEDMEIKIGAVQLLSASEKRRLLLEFNDTTVLYPKDTAIHQLFEAQAAKTPDRIAVVFENQKLTYRELNTKSNQIARFLRKRGVAENQVIGIIVERSLELLIGILAVLKASGAYLPIDPDYPQERVEYLLEHSGVSLMLMKQTLVNRRRIPQGRTEVLIIEELSVETEAEVSNLNLPYHPDGLFYVLYTSGSTGAPKGARIKSHAFVNLISWFTQEFQITDVDRTLLIAPVSFDLAQKNLFAPLVTGGRLYLQAPGPLDYNRISETLAQEAITFINCTPSAFYPIIDFNLQSRFTGLETLRLVFLGGEPINIRKLSPWIQSENYRGEIVNTYGPTECTDIASFYRLEQTPAPDFEAPIGKPIQNVQLYILDETYQLKPVGVPGELYIGGTGLAEGYDHDEQLTTAKFIELPEICSGKVYRTGDLVRWRPDGNIEFLGRKDYQVKIRGYRIELGEIETQLLKCPNVNDAVVIAKEAVTGQNQLWAYYVSAPELDLIILKEHLAKVLPGYMIPENFVRLDHLPLTPNGKVDRKKLRDEARVGDSMLEYESPGNALEEKIAAIWSQLLGAERIGVSQSFFDLGGNSLLLVQLQHQLQLVFNREIAVVELFKYPTIRTLANYLSQTGIEAPSYDDIYERADKQRKALYRRKTVPEVNTTNE